MHKHNSFGKVWRSFFEEVTSGEEQRGIDWEQLL